MSNLEASELPTGWESVPIGDVGRVRLGRQRTPDKHSGRYPVKYLRAANIVADGLDLSDVAMMDFTPEEQKVFALRDGDVVLAEGSGSSKQVGRPAIWREELPLCCFQNTVIRFRPHAVSAEYAEIVFTHYAKSGIFGRAARGIGVHHLGSRRFAELDFPLPPIAEQNRIVAEFKRRRGELEEGREALRAALEGCIQLESEVLALAASGALLGEGDRSGEWESVALGKAGDLRLGKALSRKKVKGQKQRPYFRVANVLEDHLDTSDLKEMGFTAKEFERYELEPGDVLLTEGGTYGYLGRPAMYRGEPSGIGFQNHLLRFRAKENVDPEFALLLFRHYFRAGEFDPYARGSTGLANLSHSRLAKMPIRVPPLAEQREIVRLARQRLEVSNEQKGAIESALESSDELWTALLQAAVAGDLVEQDPGDESAAELLARIGPPPDQVVEPAVSPAMEEPQEIAVGAGETTLGQLVKAVLQGSKEGVTLSELCHAVRLDTDDVGELEALYGTLRAAIGVEIKVHGEGEDSVLEAIRDEA
jgi:type I restriction enzyme S subunit